MLKLIIGGLLITNLVAIIALKHEHSIAASAVSEEAKVWSVYNVCLTEASSTKGNK